MNPADATIAEIQAQLDETARGLIASFAESDQSGGGGAARTGLFTYSGAPAVPAAPTRSWDWRATTRSARVRTRGI